MKSFEFELADVGGAFDPVTKKHLTLFKELVEKGVARRVVVSPADDHVDKNNLAPFSDRLNMVRMAVETGLPSYLQEHIIVSDIERRINGKGRSILRLGAIQKITNETPIMILGRDYLDPENGLVAWGDYEDLVNNFPVRIVRRGGHEVKPEWVPRGVSVTDWGIENGGAWLARLYAAEQNWTELQHLVVPWVLTYIRDRAEEGKPLY